MAPAFRPAALAFGSAWHSTIGEWLTKPATEIQPEHLRAHLRDGIITGLNDDGANVLFDNADQDEGTLVDSALRMLDVFLAQVPRPEKTLAVEMAFSLELSHAKTGEVLPVPLIGSIDAVVLAGGIGSVWELKTAVTTISATLATLKLRIGSASRRRLTVWIAPRDSVPCHSVVEITRASPPAIRTSMRAGMSTTSVLLTVPEMTVELAKRPPTPSTISEKGSVNPHRPSTRRY